MPQARKTTGTCGYCKRERPDHRPKCPLDPANAATTPRAAKKRKAITRGHPMKPKKAAGAVANGLISELEALTAVVQALTAVDGFESKRNILLCVCKLLAIDPTKLAA